MKCCNYDEKCPEWQVIKGIFVLIDDWNHYMVLPLPEVDNYLKSAEIMLNSNGIFLYGDWNDMDEGKDIYITKDQYDKLCKQWDEFKKKNKKLFEEE